MVQHRARSRRSRENAASHFAADMLAAALVMLSLTAVGATDKWPQFRGPNAGVADDDPALPDTWSETDNVVWKTTIPGMGWSSPVVWGDHVFLTSAVSAGKELAPVKGLYDPGDEFGKTKAAADHRWVVYDIDYRTGKIRWARELQIGTPPLLRHIKNSFASETPVTDGERVYAYFGSIGLLTALDMNGDAVWKQELGATTGRRNLLRLRRRSSTTAGFTS
jgi:PQQ-like domain